MYVIPIGGVDFVLGLQWFRTIGMVSMNYNELFMRIKQEGIQLLRRKLPMAWGVPQQTEKPQKSIPSQYAREI